MQQNIILQSTTAQEAYEKACAALGEQPKTLDPFNALYGEAEGQAKFSQHRVETVIKAVKEGHEFDWNDSSEYKYFPWWDMETYDDAPAASGFSLFVVRYDLTHSYVGARLSSRTREAARAIAELMIEDYRNFIK